MLRRWSALLLAAALATAEQGAKLRFNKPPAEAVCLASATGLRNMADVAPEEGWYCATTVEQLKTLMRCEQIDHFCIANCADCTQAMFDECQLEVITGKDPVYGDSLGEDSLLVPSYFLR